MNNSERSDFIISPIIGRWWLKALKITEKIIRENAFELKKKKPGLSANRPSNNWAQSFCLKKKKNAFYSLLLLMLKLPSDSTGLIFRRLKILAVRCFVHTKPNLTKRKFRRQVVQTAVWTEQKILNDPLWKKCPVKFFSRLKIRPVPCERSNSRVGLFFSPFLPGLHTVFFQSFAVMHFGDIAGKQIPLYYVTQNEATQNN